MAIQFRTIELFPLDVFPRGDKGGGGGGGRGGAEGVCNWGNNGDSGSIARYRTEWKGTGQGLQEMNEISITALEKSSMECGG